jgi:hypothetical protein
MECGSGSKPKNTRREYAGDLVDYIVVGHDNGIGERWHGISR